MKIRYKIDSIRISWFTHTVDRCNVDTKNGYLASIDKSEVVAALREGKGDIVGPIKKAGSTACPIKHLTHNPGGRQQPSSLRSEYQTHN